MKKVKNFARFYALFSKLPGADQELKEELINTFTNERTTSLREMYVNEYNLMCDTIQSQQGGSTRKSNAGSLKKQRSAVLHRLQMLGVNTADWSEVDKFCLNSRIAGKKFYNLTEEELALMVPKLEAIARKPAKPKATPAKLNRKPEVDELITDYYIKPLLIDDFPKHLLN